MLATWGCSTGARPTLDLQFAGATSLDSRITFTRASTATYFNSAGVLSTAAINTARLDYNPSTLAPLGLLIEEQRTNSIRNNTMVGAVAGTPGTEPTYWASSTSGSGLTREIVSTGTEDGIAYIDVRFSGTPSAGSNVTINCDAANSIAATAGQTWTEAIYVKLQAGSFTNTTTTLSLLATNGTSGTESFVSSTITSTPTSLRNCRLSVTGTLAAALGTTNVQPRVRIGYTVGVAFDITLRIGLPQLELGAFATSVIPTTTTALTRNADVASMTGTNFSSWYNASEGTLFEQISPNAPVSYGTNQYLSSISDGTVSNRISMFRVLTSGLLGSRISTAGVAANPSDSAATMSANTTSKLTISYKAGATNSISCLNGVLTSASSPTSLPVVNTLYLGVNELGSAQFMNGTIQRIAYYPTRLANSTLQALTA